MRLTLRTLLAYLDDRLSSGNAREIGKKVKDSPFAQELADRISTVVRQRRLAVPGRNVKTIDPNLIAEYLDDQLTPELVSRIEKEILSSDYSLAEVAASHQILGLLGDPVELNDRVRSRLLALSPKRSPDDTTDHELEKMSRPSDRKASDAESNPDQDVWKPLAPQRSFSPKSPALIITLMFVAWAVLLLRPDGAWQAAPGPVADSQTKAEGTHPVDNSKGEPDGDLDASNVANVDEPSTDANESADSPDDDSSTPKPNEDEAVVVAQKDPDQSARATEPSDDESSDVPTPDADADKQEMTTEAVPIEPAPESGTEPADDVAAADPEPADPQPVVQEPPVRKRFQFAMTAPHNMVLTREIAGGEWELATNRQGDRPDWHDLLTKDLTALSAPYRANVTPLKAGWSAGLLGPCLLRFSDGTAPGIELYDGRCIIERDKLAADGESATIRLIHGDIATACQLVGPGARLGVAVFALPPDVAAGNPNAEVRSEILPLNNNVEVSVFVANGTASLQIGALEAMELGNGRAARWVVRDGVAEELVVSEPSQLNAIPEWVYSGDDVPVAPVNSAAETLAAEVLKADSLVEAAIGLTTHRNALVAAGAASILSVCRDVEALTATMLSTKEEAVRIEAINGLRQTAAQSLDAQNVLLKELGNRLPSNALDDAVRLLQGISPVDVEDEEASQWLIGLLDHDRAAIRQMAIMALVELTGERHGYHPDNDRGRRRDSITRWQKTLKRNKGRLVPPK